ncbi:MAG: hypothetical protein QNK31_11680 [Porticoccus sp.]|nr:hypothetical protein [Porticoccus sp.]
MKIVIQILSLFALMSLQAWAATPSKSMINWNSAEDIGEKIEFKLDPENGEVTYGPNFADSDKALSDHFSEIYLTRLIDHKGADHYALYITAQYDDKDWRAYKDATNVHGDKLPMVTLSKNENVCENAAACRYEERLAIPLSFLYFFDGATVGMDLTISGNRTDQIKIPTSYFKAMLNSMPEEKLYDGL